MSQKPVRKLVSFILIFFVIFLVFSSYVLKDNSVKAIEPDPYYEPIERFGITVPYPTGVESLIESINVRAVLDWRLDNTSLVLKENVEYIHVIRVSDAAYGDGSILTTLPAIINNNLGEVWIIGNEPDRYYYQDSITAEVYAQRYYDIATLIRATDTSAEIGFGSVVQPTPIRIRYLEKALNELVKLANNNRVEAMALIDIWSIHAFILNEHPSEWGAGIPVGFEDDWSDAELITDFSDTYSIDKFSERVIYFRTWMDSMGERDKPLWITEYGSLFPPIDPVGGPNYVNVSDELTSEFMIDTFNFMLSASDSLTGLSEDNNRLVQRWFWYSLNEYRYNFGGSFFDPDNNNQITLVGSDFINYTNYLISEKFYLPLVFK